MKSIILLIFSVLVFNVVSQDTIYYNSNWQKVESVHGASYTEVLFRDQLDTNKVQEFIYYMTDKLKSEKNYSNYKDKIIDGKDIWYSRSGQLRGERTYKEGEIDGKFSTYWENGKLKRSDFYELGKFIEGKCFNEKGKTIKYYEYETPASFPGGIPGMMKFLASEMKYPENAIDNEIEGKVLLKFVVSENGSVKNVQVIKGVNKEIDVEAIRSVSKMPKWNPAKRDGEFVKSYYNIPVNFKLN